MLAVIIERGALDAGRVPACQPQLTRFGHRDAAAVGGVDSGANVDGDLRVIGIGIALAHSSK